MESGVCLTKPETPSLPLPPRPTGQFTEVFGADFRFPIRAGLGEKVGPDVGGAAAIGAVNDDDVVAGELYAGIGLGDLRIVPLGDLCPDRFPREPSA